MLLLETISDRSAWSHVALSTFVKKCLQAGIFFPSIRCFEMLIACCVAIDWLSIHKINQPKLQRQGRHHPARGERSTWHLHYGLPPPPWYVMKYGPSYWTTQSARTGRKLKCAILHGTHLWSRLCDIMVMVPKRVPQALFSRIKWICGSCFRRKPGQVQEKLLLSIKIPFKCSTLQELFSVAIKQKPRGYESAISTATISQR